MLLLTATPAPCGYAFGCKTQARVQTRHVQASARHGRQDGPSTLMTAAAAAVLLAASPLQAAQMSPTNFQVQEIALVGDGQTDDSALGTPGSESRYNPGQPLPGDEEKIREARKLLLAEEQSGAANKPGQEFTKTNSFLDPLGRKESAKPQEAGT